MTLTIEQAMDFLEGTPARLIDFPESKTGRYLKDSL